MPYDAERVMELRKMLREARKQKLSAGLRARREKGKHEHQSARLLHHDPFFASIGSTK